MTNEIFIEELKKIGVNIDSEIISKLEMFYQLLIEWNEKINLTRIVEKKEVYLKHYYDSLTIARVCNLSKVESLCDVGTGAGFPGIVLKIVYPKLKITLIDSLNKRVIFLNDVISKLQLKDIFVIHTRMEDYSKKNVERYDVITSRAVASVAILSEISSQSMKINGHLILLKSHCSEELEECKPLLKELGCEINKIDRFELPIEKSERTLVDIIKLYKTSSKYPRSIDKIKKSHCKKNTNNV